MIDINQAWDENKRRSEADVLGDLERTAQLEPGSRAAIVTRATSLVEQIREASRPGLMETFLAEYGLSTSEGVALMCLAEALLRVPDPKTIDALIEDKIAPSNWSDHLGQSSSPLVNASTWGLLLTGRVLDDAEPGVAGTLRSMVRRLGEPVIRTAVAAAIKQMGRQFVLGEDIGAAMQRARGMEANGYTYSYDMLGEGAITAADAQRYARAYRDAIAHISAACKGPDITINPGISVKLSALHPRYEVAQTDRVMTELVPVLTGLARQAADAGMGLNIDAEEANRLALSLKVVEATLADPRLAGWSGFGVVVQAYGQRAGGVIDELHRMAETHDRRIMVRLVKGAYWDMEIKHAQVQGLDGFPVFTRKAASDVSYIGLAQKLLRLTDRIYPQFATHNAHSVAAVLEMAEDLPREAFEFQRLHGMGEALHDLVLADKGTRCRIYAPVGAHRDLLAYLVRRLLENGANSSFVNQIVDKSVPASVVAACPFEQLATDMSSGGSTVTTGPELFAPDRRNAAGFDLSDVNELSRIDAARQRPAGLTVGPIIAGTPIGGISEAIADPSSGEIIGSTELASADDVATALSAASPWTAPPSDRATVLRRAADMFEAEFGEAFALLAAEAGKTLGDAVAELREAVDFLRYYAREAETLETPARGVFTCISPWNFPLAIFSGQVAAALAAGNAVLAKPAETTPAIAAWAVQKLHQAGVPHAALQFLPGTGSQIGTALTSDPRVGGVAFTGSTATARRIQSAMATGCAPGTPLIAETGGLNAMIVDSTALPEQAVRDIIVSAFQSAGQRCSALRCLYLQEDIAAPFLERLAGAMDELVLGNPWDIATDIGPIISETAAVRINAYIDAAARDGRLIHRREAPNLGSFVGPALISVSGIDDLEEEVFGPVLHVATFKADEIDRVIAAINATGYGLTFGLHTRIDDRVQTIADAVDAGNIYANRNQIGAIVGSQPFGGEGLSGTGPKAGGPHYLTRFTASPAPQISADWATPTDIGALKKALRALDTRSVLSQTQILPGPTGELNRLTTLPRAPLMCAGPGPEAVALQCAATVALGGQAVCINGVLDPMDLHDLPPFGGLIWWGEETAARAYAEALSQRQGPIIPLITGHPDKAHACLERHLCVDTTAAGGNAALLAGERSNPRRVA
ncbi:MAG: bifunctional proline dehydrogenase/L-glutamate gamma-semialdehyde dehydrogenase PutA [Rhizobiales bacterium]|nr:bifunctional proline dehydrogenase/L-glutamate gamma-semialdehyde dehydrogenase PutA [Hyphomicrobiales bacterium]MBO6697877.1 bifunctional proline dehydrogenase/L-glutamate gamma-semialdehyde dehydrogenase PutA [Hyphomicrobiales bacterium]MBO6735869.1 bifunctional proline dehydrogenase/L-glutamate gamma-semialdehyde dehydrogenase PutA [Hyphomicrobiales bacterium]MBO6913880.1 bifunctional proline dehydrogenase/L-glutamate gamma-semialdehyde dehydrogenase PutA [Hyphomicrobiales bacterium]MBO69